MSANTYLLGRALLTQQNLDTLQAVKQSASQRLRPIMMTTGAIPLALASGAGAESRRQIGWMIVGGMSLGTLLTIFCGAHHVHAAGLQARVWRQKRSGGRSCGAPRCAGA